MNKYLKIIVVGCPGSGKSYFSTELSKITNIPVYHLDIIGWKPNWVKTQREELQKLVGDIMIKSEWIIDGNYSGTMEDRFMNAEVVFFFDLPTEVCLQGASERIGKPRYGFPDYLDEKEDCEFLDYIRGFKETNRLKIISLIEKYPDLKVITFKSRDESNSYLNSLLK